MTCWKVPRRRWRSRSPKVLTYCGYMTCRRWCGWRGCWSSFAATRIHRNADAEQRSARRRRLPPKLAERIGRDVRVATEGKRMDKPAIEQAVEQIIEGIGENPKREGLLGTPRRIAEMYEELFAGLKEDPRELLEVGFDDEDHHELVVVKDIPFYSMCVPSKQLVDAVGGKRRGADVKVGDWLYTLDQGEVRTTKVVAVSHRPAQELVRITPADSTPFFVTPEHPIMTPDGWRSAGELDGGNRIERTHPRRYVQRRDPA